MESPEFREVFMCKLTTSTTCYSANRQVVQEDPALMFLATENHTLQVQLNSKEDVSIIEHAIPIPVGIPKRMAKKLLCVGYAAHDDGWEALVVLDTSKSSLDSCPDAPLVLSQDDDRTGTVIRRRVSSGNASVSSTSSTTDGTASLSSASSAPAAITVTTTTTTTNTSTTTDNPRGPPSLQKLVEEEHDEQDDDDHVEEPIARLILQHHASRRRFTKALEFRPLSPSLCVLQEGVMGIWVGSSDDSKLRLFRNDSTSEMLVEVSLEDDSNNKEATSFQTPVMAVACLTTSMKKDDNLPAEEEEQQQKQLLAVACQDGTVRFIGYQWLDSTSSLNCQEEYSVVVDGPIVCLHLVSTEEGDVQAVIGSLCGYVARFSRTAKGQQWKGPYMVAEGFDDDDSVLTVHAFDNKVALGTYSGRCLLYEAGDQDDEEDPRLPYWDCQLPNPIHGICHIPASPPESLMSFFVTTRRSIHVFRQVPKVYDPEAAKRKLQALLARQEQKRTAPTTTTTAEPDQPKEETTPPSVATSTMTEPESTPSPPRTPRPRQPLPYG